MPVDDLELSEMAEAIQNSAAGYVDDEDPSVVSGKWSIQKIGDLEWALRRDAALLTEINEIEAAVQQAKQRIEERGDYLIARLMKGVRFFEGHIQHFAEKTKEALLGGSAKKSRTFLYGTVGWRTRPQRLVVKDKDALNTWLIFQNNTDLYRARIEPDMRAIQDMFKKTGEIPPGMEVAEESESFYIDPVDPAAPGLKKL